MEEKILDLSSAEEKYRTAQKTKRKLHAKIQSIRIKKLKEKNRKIFLSQQKGQVFQKLRRTSPTNSIRNEEETSVRPKFVSSLKNGEEIENVRKQFEMFKIKKETECQNYETLISKLKSDIKQANLNLKENPGDKKIEMDEKINQLIDELQKKDEIIDQLQCRLEKTEFEIMEPEMQEFALQKTILMSQMMEEEKNHTHQLKKMQIEMEALQINSETLEQMETMKKEIAKLKEIVRIKTEQNKIYGNTYNKKDHEKIQILEIKLHEREQEIKQLIDGDKKHQILKTELQKKELQIIKLEKQNEFKNKEYVNMKIELEKRAENLKTIFKEKQSSQMITIQEESEQRYETCLILEQKIENLKSQLNQRDEKMNNLEYFNENSQQLYDDYQKKLKDLEYEKHKTTIKMKGVCIQSATDLETQGEMHFENMQVMESQRKEVMIKNQEMKQNIEILEMQLEMKEKEKQIAIKAETNKAQGLCMELKSLVNIQEEKILNLRKQYETSVQKIMEAQEKLQNMEESDIKRVKTWGQETREFSRLLRKEEHKAILAEKTKFLIEKQNKRIRDDLSKLRCQQATPNKITSHQMIELKLKIEKLERINKSKEEIITENNNKFGELKKNIGSLESEKNQLNFKIQELNQELLKKTGDIEEIIQTRLALKEKCIKNSKIDFHDEVSKNTNLLKQIDVLTKREQKIIHSKKGIHEELNSMMEEFEKLKIKHLKIREQHMEEIKSKDIEFHSELSKQSKNDAERMDKIKKHYEDALLDKNSEIQLNVKKLNSVENLIQNLKEKSSNACEKADVLQKLNDNFAQTLNSEVQFQASDYELEIAKLNIKITNLKKENENEQTKNENHIETINELKDENNMRKNAMRSIQIDGDFNIDKMVEQEKLIREYGGKIKHNENQLAQVTREKDILRIANVKLKLNNTEEIEILKSALTKYDQKIAEQNQIINNLQDEGKTKLIVNESQEILIMKQKIKKLDKDQREKIATLNSQSKELNAKNEASNFLLKLKIDALEKKIEHDNENKSELQNQIEKMQIIQQKKEELNLEQIENLNQDKNKLENESKIMKRKFEKSNLKYENLQNLETENKNLKIKFEEVHETLRKLNSLNSENQKTITNYKNETKQLRKQIETVWDQDIAKAKRELAENAEKLIDQAIQIGDLKHNHEVKIEAFKSKLNSQDAKLEKQNLKLKNFKAHYNQSKSQTKSDSISIQSLKGQLEIYKSINDKQKKDITNATEMQQNVIPNQQVQFWKQIYESERKANLLKIENNKNEFEQKLNLEKNKNTNLEEQCNQLQQTESLLRSIEKKSEQKTNTIKKIETQLDCKTVLLKKIQEISKKREFKLERAKGKNEQLLKENFILKKKHVELAYKAKGHTNKLKNKLNVMASERDTIASEMLKKHSNKNF